MDLDRPALEEACDRLGIRMLVLFGSHAPGGLTPGPESDFDLAIAFRQHPSAPPFHEVSSILSKAFPGRTPDPVFFADADPLFRWEIMDRGVLLYGDVDEFLEYRAFAYRDFVDSADLRALEGVLFEKKMNRIRERLSATT